MSGSGNGTGRPSSDLPTSARVVIVGGGVIGTSVAYHLARRGWGDVVLLERHRLTSGTTWHAAGLVTQMRASSAMSRLVQTSIDAFHEVERTTGLSTGFRAVGQITLATTPDRLTELRLAASRCRTVGIECELLSPAEVLAKHPLVDGTDLIGGLWFPGDGVANPTDTTQALAKGARDGGVRIIEETAATAILRDGRTVTGVRTARGDIATRIVVNAAGLWARSLAASSGVAVPLHAVQHMYLITDVIPGLAPDLPVIKAPDEWAYVREDAGKLLVGFFEPDALPWSGASVDNEAYLHLPDALDHLAPHLERLTRRLPVLADAGIRLSFNGPESFTPDGRMIVGEAPELSGYFVAAGLNSIGLLAGPGVGAALADQIVEGAPTLDLAEIDIRRFQPFQANRRYLESRVTEIPGALYRVGFPARQAESARGLRRTPLHERTAAAGACFGELSGWERPNWYGVAGEHPAYEYGFERPAWFHRVAAEHQAVRGSVGLFDLSSFGKVAVEGVGASTVLQRLSTADVDVDDGRIVYTQWLNEAGGIDADLTVLRVAHDRFVVQTATATIGRVMDLLQRAARGRTDVHLADVSSQFALIAVMGPNSRDLLGRVTDADISSTAFPFGHSRDLDLCCVRARATRISYVGELGWELLVSADMAVHVLDALVEAGAHLDVRLAGYHALDTLRLEKGYRDWGHDIGPLDTPLESGLAFTVAWDKPGGFVGDVALRERRSRPLDRRLVSLRLLDPEPTLFHDEPVWRHGRLVGHLASGGYGHTVGSALGLAWLDLAVIGPREAPLPMEAYEVEIGGIRHAAVVSTRSFFDPTHARLRS
jgi:heterotetrameric sarcosine oxidase gamma subunit